MKRDTWRKRLKSLWFQITAFNLIAGLLIVSLFGAVVYVVVSDIFVKENVMKTEMAIEKTAVEIGADIRHAKSLLQLLTTTPAFMDYAKTGDGEETVIHLMNAITDAEFYVFGVFAAFADGRVISESPSIFESSADYQSLLANDMPFLTTARAASYDHNDGCVITMGVPIELDDGSIPGVLALDLDYCMVDNAISAMDIGGGITITDTQGTVIFPIGGQAAQPGELGYNPKTNVLTQRYMIPETQWWLTGRVYLSGLDVIKRQLLDMVALTGVLLFLAMVLIAAAYSRKLTTPLKRLAGSMEDIESLQELSALTGEISETQVLTESYNRMIQKIKQLMAELEHKQHALRQTEIEALTQQINPHFLYNTLDTIVWLAEFKDNDKIIALTKTLAKFFRLSLAEGRAIVSLADEAAHAQQYLYIQKERYGERLTYTFDIPEALQDCMVPKIVLQPIVENSIYHGIKPMDGIGHIAVSARQQGELLLLTVEDNGVGFDPDTPRGVGLRNVDQRLKLYFGEDAGITLRSAPGEGTTVVLTMKMQLKNTDIAGTL